MRIEVLRDRAHRSIGLHRGYVAESVAAEWAISHSHSISDLVLNDGSRRDPIADQIACLFFNTMCMSAQYNVDIKHYYKIRNLDPTINSNNIPIESTVGDVCHKLVAHTSRLIATLAFYHGWNHDRTLLPLGEHIVDIHILLYQIAGLHKIDLPAYIDKVVARAQTLSETMAPLVDIYHPSSSRVISLFSPIRDDSVCTFAKGAVAWGARPYNKEIALSNNLHSNMGTFARFARATKYELVEAFIFQFPPHFGDSVDKLARLLNTVLTYYSSNDPKNDNSVSHITDSNWRYRFNGMPMFVQTFGPCYGADNSRYAFNAEQTFIQFVSEETFHRATAKDPQRWQQARDVIRKRAQERSQPYDIHPHEALTFVHSLRAGDPPVRWQDMKGFVDE